MLQIAPVEIALKLNQTNGGMRQATSGTSFAKRIRKCERLRAASICLCVCLCVCECACIYVRVCEGVMCPCQCEYVPHFVAECVQQQQHNANGDNGRKEACRLSHFLPSKCGKLFPSDNVRKKQYKDTLMHFYTSWKLSIRNNLKVLESILYMRYYNKYTLL